MQNFLKSLDLFKVVPDTHFQGDKGGHSSKIGQILTILIVCVGIFMLVYFSLDMIQRTHPLVQSTTSASVVDIIINNQTFPFAVGLRDAQNRFYVNESIYSVGAVYGTSRRKVNMVQCKPTYFPSAYNPETEGPLWCFSDQQDEVKEIGVSSLESLLIEFQYCQNSSTASCLPQEQIDAHLFNNHARIYYNDFVFEPADYESPIKQSLRIFNPSLTTKMIKETALNIAQNYYASDDGWLFKNIKNDARITVDTIAQYFEDKEVMGNVFKQIYFRAISEVRATTRTYAKIQDVFARWNAIFTLLLVVAKIISDSYNKFKTQETLVRDIFFLKDKKLRRLRTEKRKQTKNNRISLEKEVFNEEEPRLKTENGLIVLDKPSLQLSRKGMSPPPSPKMGSRIIGFEDLEDFKEQKEEPKAKDKSGLNINSTNNIEKENFNANLENKSIPLSPHFQNDSPIMLNKTTSSKLINHQGDNVKVDINEISNTERSKNDRVSNDAVTNPAKTNRKKTKKAKPSKSLKNDLIPDGGISFCSWLFSKVKETEEYKIFIKRNEIIQKEFDFQNYAKRFIGIDLLKYLLLTKDQQIVFDNCIKAYVNLKLNVLVQGKDEDESKFEDLRILLKNQGFNPILEEKAMENLRAIKNPDEKTKKILGLLEILFPTETEIDE